MTRDYTDNETVRLVWHNWFHQLRRACQKRGYKTDLAEYLGVPRQRLNDWFKRGMLPGWAVLGADEWARNANRGTLCGQWQTREGGRLRKCVP